MMGGRGVRQGAGWVAVQDEVEQRGEGQTSRRTSNYSQQKEDAKGAHNGEDHGKDEDEGEREDRVKEEHGGV